MLGVGAAGGSKRDPKRVFVPWGAEPGSSWPQNPPDFAQKAAEFVPLVAGVTFQVQAVYPGGQIFEFL